MHGDVTRAFVHHLHTLRPSPLGQLALRVKFGELRFVIRISDRARSQTVANGKADVVRRHDLADLIPMRVEKTFLMMRKAPLGHDGAAARNDSSGTLRGKWNVAQKHARMHRKIIHTLLSLFD